jgi:hypothetical protein
MYQYLTVNSLMQFAFPKSYLLSILNTRCSLTGHECQSTWNCFEVDIVGNESTDLSPNLGIFFSCSYLCSYPNELFK